MSKEPVKSCEEMENELRQKANPNHNKCFGRGYRSWNFWPEMYKYLVSTGLEPEKAKDKARMPIPCSCTNGND